MKTSKIIFITLLGAIAFLILATMIDIRVNGRRNSELAADFKIEKQIVSSFNVLCINNSRNITIVKNDSSYIEVTYLKDSIAPDKNFVIREDTLFISDFEKSIHRNESIRIFANDSLKWIELENSQITLGKAAIESDQSSVWLSKDTTMKFSFKALDIVAANHSKINTGIFKIDSLGIVLQNSEAYLEMKANKISGTLSDSSKIYVRQSREISLKRDATSNIDINNY